MNRRFRLTSTLAVALLAGTALGGYAVVHPTSAAASPAANDVSQLPAGVSPQVLPDFTELAARVKPAVVTILSDLAPGAATDDGGDNGQQQGDNGPGDQGGGDQGVAARARRRRTGCRSRCRSRST